MQIEFAAGEGGYGEARELRALVRFVADNAVSGSHDRQLLDRLELLAESHMARPEFAALRDAEPPPAEDRRPLARLGALWRSLVGPSRHELALAAQRGDALARAARAEHSAFEAVAETARVVQERDAALARLAELEARAGASSPAAEAGEE